MTTAWLGGLPITWAGNKVCRNSVLHNMKLHSIYDTRRIWKTAFIVVALVMVGVFLYISDSLVRDLAAQERERMQIWANATKELASTADGSSGTDVDFLFSIIEGNHNIPVLLVDGDGTILLHRNFDLPEPVDSLSPYQISPRNLAYLEGKLQRPGARFTAGLHRNTQFTDDAAAVHFSFRNRNPVNGAAGCSIKHVFVGNARLPVDGVRKAAFDARSDAKRMRNHRIEFGSGLRRIVQIHGVVV